MKWCLHQRFPLNICGCNETKTKYTWWRCFTLECPHHSSKEHFKEREADFCRDSCKQRNCWVNWGKSCFFMRSWIQCWKNLNDLLSRTDRCRNRCHIFWRGSLAATMVSKSSWLKKTKIFLNLKTRCSIWAPVLIFSLFQAPWRCQLKKTIVSESHYYILRRLWKQFF